MQRFGQVIRIKPEKVESYKKYHRKVWPEVLQRIKQCNIDNYSVFYKDNYLFGYFEYHGPNFDRDMAAMAEDPKTREWWSIMGPMQEPLETRKKGEWWANMEEVFHLD